MLNSSRKVFHGKVALVTGAADDLGRSLAIQLARAGCRVGLADDSAASLHPVHAALQSMGADSALCEVDLKDRAAVHAAVEQLAGELGPADLMIHNVDQYRATAGDRPDPARVREMLEWNCLSGMYCVEAVLPAMLARGSGHIVALASLLGLRGCCQAGGYAAAVAAWTTYLESLRPALRGRGIAVTTVHSGLLRSPSDGESARLRFWRMPSPDRLVRRVLCAMLRDQREMFFPKRQALVARFVRMLPAVGFDACTRRFADPMLEYGRDTSFAEISRH